MEKSSDNGKGPRHLKRNGASITFQQWKDVYLWDVNHSLKINPKLTEGHFDMNPRSKMRNHPAEHVLDGEMRNLMVVSPIDQHGYMAANLVIIIYMYSH